MSKPSIMHRELKMFLWVQSAKVSPLTRLGLFSLLQGSQGWKLPASQRGALKPCWHRRGGRSLQSCEVYGLKSGCQSAVIAQWEWAPPARAECQRAGSHQQIIHSVFRTSLTRTKRGSSTWFPQTLSITLFISCRVCRNPLDFLSHIPSSNSSDHSILPLHSICPAKNHLN